MLRKFLDYQLSLTEKGKPLHRLHPLVEALDNFLYESPIATKRGPHIRDAVDVKRWMLLVVVALLPCLFAAIWNTGLQNFVFSSGDYRLMDEYIASAESFGRYVDFALKDYRYLTILKLGLFALLPVMIIAYLAGGLCEAAFAVVRGHELTEGFLVTGILYVLILPPTIPYWMVAVGVIAGVALGKEVFGGSGMNIVNPALACRAFLFFTFPGKMSGDVWVGTNPSVVRQSLLTMNKEAQTNSIDGYSQATLLTRFNIPQDVKRIHIDAIASHKIGDKVGSYETIDKHVQQWNIAGQHQASLADMDSEQLRQFVTSPLAEGGLNLSPAYYEDAFRFASLRYDLGPFGDWNNFLGNKLGSMGETSILACLLGAIFLIWTGVGSWRTMAGMLFGAFFSALLFEAGSTYLASDGGAWTPAVFGFPAYKHLLMGGLAFGLVFMATDPVSSPATKLGRWIYGILAGVVTIIIRVINPAYPEGVMLAILMANVFAPLIDYYVLQYSRKRSLRSART